MKKIRKPNGEEAFTSSVPMNVVFDKSFDADTLQRELKLLEREYADLIDSLKKIIQQINSKSTSNKVLLYWKLGDKIYSYERVNVKRDLTLESVTEHLARDLGVSKNVIRRCRRFRILYPEISMIDPHRSWTSYLKTFEKGYMQR
ncbi:MAG: hypothetical protein QXI50_01160 [Candidatus Caldarchaeum sp.]